MEEKAPVRFGYTKLSRRAHTASHGQPVCCFRWTSKNKWRTLSFRARSPILHLSVQAMCFKGVFPLNFGKEFHHRAKKHLPAATQIPLILSKLKRLVELSFSSSTESYWQVTIRRKNINTQSACSQGNWSVQLSKNFHFWKESKYATKTSIWILPLVCGCLCKRIRIRQETKLTVLVLVSLLAGLETKKGRKDKKAAVHQLHL